MNKGIPLESYANRVGGQLSEEVRVMPDILQGGVLGLLLFLAYVNDIWNNTVNYKTVRGRL